MQNSTSLAASPPIDSRQFRDALAQFATGVTVIATRLDNGNFIGLTATSFNSVSLDPPLVLWSLGNAARSLPVFSACSHYTVSVLAGEQAALADRFAQRIDDRFDGIAYDLSPAGLPVIRGASAWFECRNRSRYPEGDHVIFVGEVEHCGSIRQPALVFHDRQYAATLPSGDKA